MGSLWYGLNSLHNRERAWVKLDTGTSFK